MNRNVEIDFSRALAVVLVTMHHVSRGAWLPSYEIGSFDVFGFFQNGWVGVGIFFVISGFCMGISTKSDFKNGISCGSYIRYALKRFMRIAPPYYISIVFWFFVISIYKIAPKSLETRDILTHITFTHNFFKDTFFSISGVYWSIAVEMQFYLILPIIVSLCRGFKSSIFVLAVALVVSVITHSSNLSINYKWGLLNYLTLFIFGFLLFKYKEKIASYVSSGKSLMTLIVIFITLLSYKGTGYSNDQKIYEIITSFVYGLIMVSMTGPIERCSYKWLDSWLIIGKASFSIYLYNYVYNAVAPRGDNYVAMILMMVGTLGFGVLMYYVVEVNTERLRAYLFKRKNKPVSLQPS